MKFFKMKKFVADEAGAVTVDWVVLTAAMVAIGGTLISTISGGIDSAGDDIVDKLESAVAGGTDTGGTDTGGTDTGGTDTGTGG